MMLLPKNMGMIVPPAQPAAGSGALGSGALGPGLISPNHTMVPFGGLNGEGRSTSAIVYQAYYDRFSAYPPGRFPREECPHVTTRQCPVCSGQVKDVPAKGKEAGRPEIKLPEWGEAVDDSVRNDLTALLIAAHTGGVSAVAGGARSCWRDSRVAWRNRPRSRTGRASGDGCSRPPSRPSRCTRPPPTCARRSRAA